MSQTSSLEYHVADPERSAEERSLGRGLIYRFIATGYRYPDPHAVRSLLEQTGPISEALAALGDTADGRLPADLSELQAAADASDAGTLEAEYVDLFGHGVRGRCALYETEYGESDQRLQQPHELADLMAFYRAFGLKLGGPTRERVDFLAVECEFMAFLCVKQSYAQGLPDAALEALVLEAQQKFLRDHLGRWVPACTRQILEEHPRGFYSHLARLTQAFVSDDCRRLEVAPGKQYLKLRLPPSEEEASLRCPMAAENDAVTALSGLPQE
jgi:putative dimethyl sulfoxide reductase chaperone